MWADQRRRAGCGVEPWRPRKMQGFREMGLIELGNAVAPQPHRSLAFLFVSVRASTRTPSFVSVHWTQPPHAPIAHGVIASNAFSPKRLSTRICMYPTSISISLASRFSVCFERRASRFPSESDRARIPATDHAGGLGTKMVFFPASRCAVHA